MTINAESLLAVERAVEHHVSETGQLPSTPRIVDEVKFGRPKCKTLLEELVRQERLSVAFESPGNPTIFVPTHIYDGMLRQEKQPDWIEKYGFEEANEIEEEIQAKRDELSQFHRLERLLYTTGRSLEEAIDQALSLVAFDGYEALFDQSDAWDFQFEYNGEIYVADAKGKKKWASKPDVGQLVQWIDRFVDENPEADPTRVRGLLIINHFRHLDPEDRWPEEEQNRPITEEAERSLQLYRMHYLTTVDLFEEVRPLAQEDVSQEEARAAIVDGFREEV